MKPAFMGQEAHVEQATHTHQLVRQLVSALTMAEHRAEATNCQEEKCPGNPTGNARAG